MSKTQRARVCFAALIGLFSIGTLSMVAQFNDAAGQIINSPLAFIRSEIWNDVQPTENASPVNNALIPQSDQFFAGDGSALNTTKWGTSAGGPFTSGFTAGNVANFAVPNGTGTGGSITVAGLNAVESFTLSSPTGTISNSGNVVVPVNVSAGKVLDLTTQSMSGASAGGYNFTGPGVFATSGNSYGGGFTINSGTLVARGVNAMGSSLANTLAINGGTIAANATRDLSGKFGGGITITNNFQLGELSSNVSISSDTANLTFSNDVALGSATRIITIGANGTYTFGGVVSGAPGSGLVVKSGPNATGALALSGVNTYTGPTTISSGILSITTVAAGGVASSLGQSTNAASNLVFDGGTLKYAGAGDGTTNRNFTINNGKTAVIDVGNALNFTISGAAAATNGGLTKTGPGALSLTGTNLYTGNTTINGGALVLSFGGSIASSPVIEIAGGAFFDIGTATSPFTLAPGQVLKASGTTTPGTISTLSGKGLTTAFDTAIQFTAYNGVNAPLTIQNSGFISLASTNSVVVNTTTPLGIGDHVLISKGPSGSVTGTAPSTLTIGGSGLAAGTVASLQITGSQLVLHIVASPGSLQFTSATFSSNEQTLQATVTVSRTGGTSGAVSAPLTFTNGTATGGTTCAAAVDFINTGQTVSFNDGEGGTKTINIPLCNDGVYEADETFTAALGAPSGGATIGTQGSATVTITDTIPATLRVNSTADTNDGFCTPDPGGCTLREAIIAANTNSDLTNIRFNIPGSGVQTIKPSTSLPQLTQPVTIDGFSQPGSMANSMTVGDNSIHLIEIDGELIAGLTIGLDIAGTGSLVRGLVINRFGLSSIRLLGSSSSVEGNFIGTDPTGMLRRVNSVSGVDIVGSGNVVGGIVTDPSTRNVISGNNSFQVRSFASATIVNNYIGTNAAGTGRLDSSGGNGLSVQASLVLIQNNVVSANGGNGIMIFGTNGSPTANISVTGNFVGVDAAGTTRVANDGHGIQVQGLVTNSSIGDGTSNGRNIISGNGLDFGGGPFAGITLQPESGDNSTPTGISIRGNFIGTDVSGTAKIANRDSGILVTNAGGNTIGGATAGQGNVISGNFRRGVFIQGTLATNNLVKGNLIGTQADGVSPLGNGDLGGIFISATAAGNIIGGINTGEGNVIANSVGPGIRVDEFGAGNIFRGNSIYDNGGLGIDLDVAGVNANDVNDPDQNAGGDPIQNYPVLVVNDGAAVTGTLNSTPNTTFDIDFYRVTLPDASGFGEGAAYIGTQTVTTDAGGNAGFTFAPAGGTVGTITSTTTSTNAAKLSTSEFSNAVLSTTAAPVSISGRIITTEGDSVRGAAVTISGGGLAVPSSVRTDAFGRYSFTGLRPGETYIISARAKRSVIGEATRVVTLFDDLAGVDFIAEPRK